MEEIKTPAEAVTEGPVEVVDIQFRPGQKIYQLSTHNSQL